MLSKLLFVLVALSIATPALAESEVLLRCFVRSPVPGMVPGSSTYPSEFFDLVETQAGNMNIKFAEEGLGYPGDKRKVSFETNAKDRIVSVESNSGATLVEIEESRERSEFCGNGPSLPCRRGKFFDGTDGSYRDIKCVDGEQLSD